MNLSKNLRPNLTWQTFVYEGWYKSPELIIHLLKHTRVSTLIISPLSLKVFVSLKSKVRYIKMSSVSREECLPWGAEITPLTASFKKQLTQRYKRSPVREGNGIVSFSRLWRLSTQMVLEFVVSLTAVGKQWNIIIQVSLSNRWWCCIASWALDIYLNTGLVFKGTLIVILPAGAAKHHNMLSDTQPTGEHSSYFPHKKNSADTDCLRGGGQNHNRQCRGHSIMFYLRGHRGPWFMGGHGRVQGLEICKEKIITLHPAQKFP